MSNYLSVTQLRPIGDLFNARMRILADHLAALTKEQSKDDQKYQQYVQSAKRSVLLEPVTVSAPKVIANVEETRNVGPTAENMWGGPKTYHLITVGYAVAGSSEVFGYVPNGASLSGTRVYQPDNGAIEIVVTLGGLDRDAALSYANGLMASTQDLIAQANPQIQQWVEATERIIASRMDQRRTEILNLYS